MLSGIFHIYNKNISAACAVLCAAMVITGCSSAGRYHDASENADAEYIEYNGIRKSKKDLSEDTIRWMEWYKALPEDEQNALSIIPSEFATDSYTIPKEPESVRTFETVYHYSEALSDNELFETEELVRLSYEEAGDAEVLEVVPDDFPWYANKGIEDEYTPGNIIIYRILTAENRLNGNGYLIVSIGRHSKSDPWKIVNSGFLY